MKLQNENSTMETTTEFGIYVSLSNIMKTNAAIYDAASKNEIEELFSYCREEM